MRFALLSIVFAVACSKTTPAPKPIEDSAPTVLEPMETPDPLVRATDAMAQADVDLPEEPDRPQAPGGHRYKDKWDLPEDAGAGRCPNPPNGQTAVVRLEMIMTPKKTIDLVVPSLNVRKRLWKPHPSEPSSCHGGLTEKEDGLRFFCSTDEGSVGGKIYARGSDIVLGINAMSGKTQERIELPCGMRPRFEKVACPAACEKDRSVVLAKNECYCPDSAGVAPMPASTTQAR